MPELPDITVYIDALSERIAGTRLNRIRITSPFLLRSVAPSVTELEGRRVSAIERLGKRIAIGLEDDYWIVLHLMVAGRLHWRASPPAKPSRLIAAVLEFERGALTLTEAGTKKRASLHFVRGESALRAHDPGGIDVFTADFESFKHALLRESHTLKRALTDPRILSGIGNAYSDEILHRAKLSPFTLTRRLSERELLDLQTATRDVLRQWTATLESDRAGAFPEKVTAFRPGMAVHGRYRQPCPTCGSAVQRIRYASNETNYCPRCQTGGRLLADRSLSRLLKQDWPRTIEELERQGRDA